MLLTKQTCSTQQLSDWLEFSQLIETPSLIAGVDEVGRGCLFGPVVAAAVILPKAALPEIMTLGINDSKKLSASKRSQLSQVIHSVAIDWKIGFGSVSEIDNLNILQASLLAMKRAIYKLKVKPDICLIDGNQLVPNLNFPQQTIVKGDSRSLSIAAASIVAKVWRDDLLIRLAKQYSMYDLASNKGYGSKRHLEALQKYGPSPLHRKSFNRVISNSLASN
jgi:ribonuclease HII